MSHTQEQEQNEKPKRLLYPYGSASAERDDAITVLGALPSLPTSGTKT